MYTRLLALFHSVVFMLVFQVCAYAQEHHHHDHSQKTDKHQAELIWHNTVSIDLIRQHVQQTGLYTKIELEYLLAYFNQRYAQDRFYFFTNVARTESEEECQQYCDSMRSVYVNVFKGYNTHKATYLKEGQKIYTLQHSVSPSTLEVNGPCSNVDFEDGNTNGWEGAVGNACGVGTRPCNLVPGFGATRHVIQTGGYDPIVGGTLLPVVAPGGNYSLRLEDLQSGYGASSISQTFLVTAANSNFTIRYAVVLEDPGGHDDADRPYFNVSMTDDEGNSISCAEYRVIAKPPMTNFTAITGTDFGAYLYRDWTTVSIPLNDFIGKNVTVTFDVSDCALGAHKGYAYLDGSCLPFQIQSEYQAICVSAPVILYGPDGYATYQWTGPSIISATDIQDITVNQPGTYNLTIGSITGEGCSSELEVVLSSEAHTFAGNDTSVCDGNSVQLRATGVGPDVVWTPSTGLNNPNISNPIATPLVTTTYTVTSCGVSDEITVVVVDGYDITVVPDITLCNTTTTVLWASPDEPGSFSYRWTPATGLSSANVNSPSASPTDPTTYTVTVTRDDGCYRTGEVTVVVNNPIENLLLTAVPEVVCIGDQVEIHASEKIVNDNCDVLNTSLWTISGGGGSSACGSMSGNSYFFNGNATRTLTSRDWLDLRGGGIISFYLKISTGTGVCDDADVGEDVVLEYTIDGINWVPMQVFNEADYPFFTPVSMATPSIADLNGVKFRLRQVSFTAAGQDTWSVDDISITRNLIQSGDATGITYTWSPTTDLIASSYTGAIAVPTANTTYSYNINNSVTGCTYNGSVNVKVAPAFDLTLPDPYRICVGTSTTLSATITPMSAGSFEYYWHNSNFITPRFAPTVTVNPPITTTYTISVKSALGCVRKTSTDIIVIQAPVADAHAAPNPICGVQSAELTVRDILVQDTIQNTVSAVTWLTSGGTATNTCGAVSGRAVTFSAAGVRSLTTKTSYNTDTGGYIEFYIKIANGTGNCDDAEEGDDVVLEYNNGGSGWTIMSTLKESDYPDFTLVSLPLPSGAISSSTAFRWRQLQHSGLNTDVWALDNITISKNLRPEYTYTYNWSPAVALTDPLIANPLANPTTDNWYTIDILTEGMCPKKDSVLVRVVPDFLLTIDNPAITSCNNVTVTLNAQTDLPDNGYTAVWSPVTGLNDPRILTPELTIDGNATYTLTVVSAAGCRKTSDVSVAPVGTSPFLTLTASKSLVCRGDVVSLNAKVSPADCGAQGVCDGANVATTEIGSGAIITSAPYPFAGNYKDSRTQILYTKDELLTMGIEPGAIIKSVAFEVLIKQSSLPYTNFTIRIGCTAATTLDNMFLVGNTEVFTPKNVNTSMGWNTFTLDQPYTWNGRSNLVVEICYSNFVTTLPDQIKASNTSFPSVIFWYDNASTVPGCDIMFGSPSLLRPVIRFTSCAGILDDVSFTWTPTVGLSNVQVLNPKATVNQTTTYTIEVTTTQGCVSTKSKTIVVDNTDSVDTWADTTCLNGAPVPVHAYYQGVPVVPYNCDLLPALPATTPYQVTMNPVISRASSFFPFAGLYSSQRTQFIITAAELTAAGITEGAIHSLGFNVTVKSSTQPFDNLTVKLGCTSATSLSATAGFIQNTHTVYNPKSYSTVAGNNVLVFDKAYAWDGESNLIVEICWENSGQGISDMVAMETTPYTSLLCAVVVSGGGACNISPNIGCVMSERVSVSFEVYPPETPVLTYQWTSGRGTIADPVNVNTTVTTTGNTWAIFTLSGGKCTVKDSVYVRPYQFPIVRIDSTLNCTNGEFTFNSNANEFAAHIWSPAVAGNPPGFSIIPSNDYYYVLSVTNDLLCKNKDSVQVRTEGDPLVFPEDTLLCEGLDYTFTAEGGDDYTWVYGGQNLTGVDHINLLEVEEALQCTLIVTRHNGCEIPFEWAIDIMDSLKIKLTADQPHACVGLPVEFTASGADQYQWSPASLFTNQNAVQDIVFTTDTEIKVESSNRCFTDSAKLTLVVHDLPVIAKANDTTICYATPVYLHATYDPSYSYAWTPDQRLDHANIHNPVATLTGSTTYYVDVNNGFCSAYDTVVVTVLDELHAQIDASALEGDIPFTSTLSSHYPATTYSWYTNINPTAFATTQQTSYQINEIGEATVYLEIENAVGCRAVDSVHLLASYIFIPNLVTPNGDGDNDTYILVLFGHKWSITIFNRWGEQVYKNDNYQNEWGADDVSDGIYYYEVVEQHTSRTYKGWVHVVSRKAEEASE